MIRIIIREDDEHRCLSSIDRGSPNDKCHYCNRGAVSAFDSTTPWMKFIETGAIPWGENLSRNRETILILKLLGEDDETVNVGMGVVIRKMIRYGGREKVLTLLNLTAQHYAVQRQLGEINHTPGGLFLKIGKKMKNHLFTENEKKIIFSKKTKKK